MITENIKTFISLKIFYILFKLKGHPRSQKVTNINNGIYFPCKPYLFIHQILLKVFYYKKKMRSQLRTYQRRVFSSIKH